jgi:hypothetical protein
VGNARMVGRSWDRSERNSIWSVIVPTDGTRAANMKEPGDFGTSPIFVQLSDKAPLASI